MTDQRTTPTRAETSTVLTLLADRHGGATIAERGTITAIAVADTEDRAVLRAVGDLHADLRSVTGGDTVASTDTDDAQIIVGTVGSSAIIDRALASGDLTLDGLVDNSGVLHWEGYVLREVAGRLWIIGTDRRGTIYGVYALAEAAGVSPWHWWADVPDRRRDHVTVAVGSLVADHPSVRYRGLFLNDEEELDAWARAHTADGTIGPETYERVFELLLRLRANYIWPAMHVNAFNADARNGHLADAMGIVVGTSHCDMLLRSNQHEWEAWQETNDRTSVEYDYSIPDGNRSALQEYWRGSVEQNRGHDVTWTLGMRGVHDSGFATRAIDEADLTDNERARARVDLLSTVIRDQRRLLTESLPEGARPVQTFVPYKEVLDLYDAGLEVPEDVTIIWSDDSFGHIRRFPDADELRRPGGHGLYFHSSYWSPPSRSYLWISSQPLAQMRHELRKAWDRGIRTLWVNNVGSLKPLELDAEFFLRSAWEAGRETSTADTTEYLATWIDGTFTGGLGTRLAPVLETWAEASHVRRVEHLASRAFSQTCHGDEAARRLRVLHDAYTTACATMADLPAAERGSFLQLIGIRVAATYLTSAQHYFADRSTAASAQGKAQAADHAVDQANRFDLLRRRAIRAYNASAADGKWEGIMTPDDFPPPAIAQFPPATPSLVVGGPGLGVVVWGQEPGAGPQPLRFASHARSPKWIEVFTTGSGEIPFTIEADPWIEVAVSSGRVRTEQRIAVDVRSADADGPRTGTLTVTDRDSGSVVRVDVVLDVHPESSALDDGVHIETDGVVSIPAAAAQIGPGWRALTRPGLAGGDPLEATAAGSVLNAGQPALYRFVLTTAGAHRLDLHRLPSLEATGRIRVGVQVDDRPIMVIESPTTDEYRGTWETMVVEQVERLSLRLPFLSAGDHVLLVHAIDPGFVFARLVVSTDNRPRPALGAPTSPTRTAVSVPADPAPDEFDPRVAERVGVRAGLLCADNVPGPTLVHVPRSYWSAETTFTRNVTTRGQGRFAPSAFDEDGRAIDRLASLPTGPVRETDGEIAIDLAWALGRSSAAWTTPELDGGARWTVTQARPGGPARLALHVDAPGRRWDDPSTAPGIHVDVVVEHDGRFRTWALVAFDADTDDSFHLAVDGTPLPVSDQFSGGDMFAFGIAGTWVWVEITDLTLSAGRHTVSVLARKGGLRVDRLLLTTDDRPTPADRAWPST
ncbi:glycosyl hydrolase 115 family protein [Curtobacterium sp. PhB136]|uniref:glycosyl hydrolase 115 family protein n=1 Tax=Curtobacterium sp. PhB136 TaxID=2485181 RepID=UPI00104AFED7|nr:glycosyl hydrolase 115 family protein [Curtobacterium sp. PhB136]TCK59246.1 glycosyl hydrolase family 115 (putative glucuronidase) [Curtobacterium sp. PhB136]